MSRTQHSCCLGWAAVLVLGLVLMAPLVGCRSGHDGIEGTASSVDPATRSVILDVMAAGDRSKYVVLVVTYPDGHQITPAIAAMLRDGYCTWFGTDMSPGTYSYAVYWVPAAEAHDQAISVDNTLISHGNAACSSRCRLQFTHQITVLLREDNADRAESVLPALIQPDGSFEPGTGYEE